MMELCRSCKMLQPSHLGWLYFALIILVITTVQSASILPDDAIDLDDVTTVSSTEIPPTTTALTPLNDPSVAERGKPWRKEKHCVPNNTRRVFKFANDAKNLFAIRDCTVLEGSLHIIWMHINATAENYTRAVLPNLTEITGNLLLYRLQKLTDVGVLFPNLRVIRGQELVLYNYALVVYEMEDLQALNLKKLSYLGQGYTAQKNPNMCYNSRIEWRNIIPNYTSDKLFHHGNRVESLCKTFEACGDDACKRNSNCWNANVCTKRCPERCGARGCVDNSDKCCHEQCLGGCVFENDPTACYACKNIFHEGTCSEKCPTKDLYGYHNNRRCITARECLDLNKLNKFYDQQCVYICPAGYLDNKDIRNSDLSLSPENFKRHECVKCDGPCDKVCDGQTVDSVVNAKRLRDCTIINGSLDFRFAVNGLVNELKKYTERIHTIRGAVSLQRSHFLQDISFLPQLKEIQNVNNADYAISINNNENLQELWPEDSQITIRNGSVEIQQNARLCSLTIRRLLDKNIKFIGTKWNGTAMTPISKDSITEREVSQVNNGQFGSCFQSTLNLTLSVDTYINWINFNFSTYFEIEDRRQIICYYVYYRPVGMTEEVSYYSSREVCSSTDLWKVKDYYYEGSWETKRFITGELIGNPYTRYAVYVETLMAFEKGRSSGAQSPIKYITTNPDEPSAVRILEVISFTSPNTGLKIKWEPPANPNGILHEYKVFYRKKAWPLEVLNLKNFCENKAPEIPVTTPTVVTSRPQLPVVTGEPSVNESCGQTIPLVFEKELKANKKSAEFRLEFENKLQNIVFEKYTPKPDEPKTDNPDVSSRDTSASATNTSALTPATTPASRKKRQASNSPSTEFTYSVVSEGSIDKPITSSTPIDTNTTESTTDSNTAETPPQANEGKDAPSMVVVNASTYEVSLFNLEPQTEYIIEIVACQAYHEFRGLYCSQKAVKTAYTDPDPMLDVIEDSSLKKVSLENDRLNLTWAKPEKTNGPILTYKVKYETEGDTDSTNRPPFCVQPKVFDENGGTWVKDIDSLPRGKELQFSVRVETLGQPQGAAWTAPLTIYLPVKNDSNDLYITLGVFFAILVICCVIFTLVCWKRFKDRKIPKTLNVTTINPDYIDTDYIYTADEWEIDRSKIIIGKVLGNGSFGMVYEGIAKELPLSDKINLPVAIKTNSSTTAQEGISFLQEATRMKAMDCHHIVKLLAVVSQGNPKLVVMELMAQGDLKNYLRMHRPDESDNDGRKPPTLGKILQMAAEIADGMCYIAEKKYVHRDLAARNCMVSADMTVKIGDFGMSRDIYETDYYRKGGRGLLPVRWMSPESLRDGVYTCKSDVWSYGVVLWEMATLATQPYPGLGHDEVYNYVVSGRTMEMPDGCPEKLFSLMKECWRYYPKYRPTFHNILEQLQGDVHRSFFQCSWYYTHRDNNSNSGSHPSDLDDTDESQPLNPDSHHGSIERAIDNFYIIDGQDSHNDEPSLRNHEDSMTRSDSRGPPEIPYKPDHLINTDAEPLTNGHGHSISEESIPHANESLVPQRILPEWTGGTKNGDCCNGSANGHLKFNQLTTAC